MTEEARGIRFVGNSVNEAEKEFVTKNGEATGRRRSVCGEQKHVHYYRAIHWPICQKTHDFSELRRMRIYAEFLDATVTRA